MCHSDVCVCVCVYFQGIVAFPGKAHQVMLQGVHELYELNETPQLWGDNPRINRLVFIGEDTHVTPEFFKSSRLCEAAQAEYSMNNKA